MSACECGKCHEHFTGISAFDRHQVVDYTLEGGVSVTCLPPADVGLRRDRHGRWGRAPDPDRPNPWGLRPADPVDVSSMADGDRNVKLA